MQLARPAASVTPEQLCEPSVNVTVTPATGLTSLSTRVAANVARLSKSFWLSPLYVREVSRNARKARIGELEPVLPDPAEVGGGDGRDVVAEIEATRGPVPACE